MTMPFSPMRSFRPCVKHFSHCHPLRPTDLAEEDEIICSGCGLDLSGSAYKCSKSKCEFFLHKSCFDLPPKIEHQSHPQHPLALLASHPYLRDTFTCDACGDYGTSFTYHCSCCSYDLHAGCAFLPKFMKHVGHRHPLTLFYSSSCNIENVMFTCDVCKKAVPESRWVYLCEECDYGINLACVVPEC